jgi:hypothetical protein
MLCASHFLSLSQDMENGFVLALLNFIETSFGETTSHGLCERFAAGGILDMSAEWTLQARVHKQNCGSRRKKRERRKSPHGEGCDPADSGHESEGQEARAEQDQTGCGQGQETVGDRIMMAHVTSSFSEARPN